MGCISSKLSTPTRKPAKKPPKLSIHNPYPTTLHANQKIRRLQSDGLVIVVDQSNLEIEGHRIAGQNPPENAAWSLAYPNLLNLIARKGNLDQPPRPILSAHCVTSENQLVRNRYIPSRTSWERARITLTIPSSRNITTNVPNHDDPAATRKEKAVDHTLVRIMTQEFEGIQLLHNFGAPRPNRTFCLVAGDFDYIDVVEQARLSGCNVEIWFWVRRDAMSRQWERELSKRHDALGTLSTHDIEPFFEYLSVWRPRERISISSDPSTTSRRKSPRTPKAQYKARSRGSTPALSPLQRAPLSAEEIAGFKLSGAGSKQSELINNGGAGHVSGEEERCGFREFCNRKKCSGWHTKSEIEHFESNGGRGKYMLAKQKPCAGPKVHNGNIERGGVCTFIHKGEFPLCVKCLRLHENKLCEVERNRVINNEEAETLAGKGYLVCNAV